MSLYQIFYRKFITFIISFVYIFFYLKEKYDKAFALENPNIFQESIKKNMIQIMSEMQLWISNFMIIK